MADLRTVLRIIARDETKGALTKTQKELKGIGTTLGDLRNQALALAGINFGIGGLASLVALADGYQLTTARLKLLSGETQNFVGLQKQVFEIAQDTFTTYEQTAALYGNLAASTKAVGVTQTELLTVTKALNQSYQISGSTQQEAAASTIQLVQALASGQIRGQEFNSVAEQGRRILFALKDATGKTAGELREFANAGKLTTEFFLKQFLPQAEKIDEEFQTLPLTVGRSLTQLQNAFEQYVGQQNQELGITREIALVFQDLAFSFDEFADTVITSGAAAIAFLSTQFLGTVGAAAEKKLDLAKASRISAIADRDAARAQVQLASASKTSAIATQQRIAQLLRERQASLAVAQSETARIAIQKEIDFLQAQSVAATNARAAANVRLAASNEAVRVTTLRAAAATKIWNTTIAFLGGPIGAVLTGIAALGVALVSFDNATQAGTAAWDDFIEDMEAGKKAAEEQKTSVDRLATSMDRLKYSAQFAQLSKAELALSKLNEQLAEQEELFERQGPEIFDPESGLASDEDFKRLDGLRDKVRLAKDVVEALKKEVTDLVKRDKDLDSEFGGGIGGIPKRLRDVIDEQKKANQELVDVEKRRLKIVKSLNDLSAQLGGPKLAIEEQTSSFNIAALNTLRREIEKNVEDEDADKAISNLERAKEIITQLQKTEGASDGYLKTQVDLVKKLADEVGDIDISPEAEEDEVVEKLVRELEIRKEFRKQNPDYQPTEFNTDETLLKIKALNDALQVYANENPVRQPVVPVPVSTAKETPAAPLTGGGFAAGGYIRGPGSGTSDSILSWLSNGEFVVRAAAVQHYGADLLKRLNSMTLPRFASGGPVRVPAASAPAASGAPIIFNLNGQQYEATISGGGAGDLRNALKRENMRRGTRA